MKTKVFFMGLLFMSTVAGLFLGSAFMDTPSTFNLVSGGIGVLSFISFFFLLSWHPERKR